MLVRFTIHKDVDIPGEMEVVAELKFYVNLWSLCFEEAELDNRLQFIECRHFGSEFTEGRCQQNERNGKELYLSILNSKNIDERGEVQYLE